MILNIGEPTKLINGPSKHRLQQAHGAEHGQTDLLMLTFTTSWVTSTGPNGANVGIRVVLQGSKRLGEPFWVQSGHDWELEVLVFNHGFGFPADVTKTEISLWHEARVNYNSKTHVGTLVLV